MSHDIIDMHDNHYYCQEVGNDGDVVEEVPEVRGNVVEYGQFVFEKKLFILI